MAPMPVPDLLETDRLVLRPRRAEHAATYRLLWTERDPRVPEHRRIDAHGRPTVADVAARLGDEPGLLAVHRRDTDEVVGYCGLTGWGSPPPDEPELVFELLRAAQGRGYATEAGQAVVAWARESGCSRLRATVWDWNVASRRVLAKLGFRETGDVVARSAAGCSLLTVRDL
ncbi:GNAT family N-acetyltransferase [Cellulomonas iranensis]|uniref:RimJ/RimL family protein N-acetyltransferase n=1 Tax=Cellulomonas iranensis TaxID=76862 RepID=A0ABU0GHY6_9CELL|nr:GNAT family N-acetyltransferase [Cellulomonas iranensis]MDQ0424985.1 RimJ/RimL family protein N-acetyltransferase [Cellulomonas iranensis]